MQQLAFLRTFKNSWATSKAGPKKCFFRGWQEQLAISRGTKQQKILQGIIHNATNLNFLLVFINSKVDFKIATFNWNRRKERGKENFEYSILVGEVSKEQGRSDKKGASQMMNINDERKCGDV